MGSYCSVKIDEHEAMSAKGYAPADFLALFRKEDRIVIPDQADHDDADDPDFIYQIRREVALQRLNALGVTSDSAKWRFDAWLEVERAEWARHREEGWAAEKAGALDSLTYDEWLRRAPKVLATRYAHNSADREPADEIDRNMREMQDSWIDFDGWHSITCLRAMLDACTESKTLTLDLSELVNNGYIDIDEALDGGARRAIFIRHFPLLPTIILAEGPSDIRVLRKALERMHPHLTDLISFFNHEELSVDGGANFLVKFLKAFAGANIADNVLAVFDNDTAGLMALRQAQALRLPHNLRVTCLPECALAKDYPTVGPQGHHKMNVNGLAASIEMYLGKDALTDQGRLRPVRWTGYVAAADAYQGEIEGKRHIIDVFQKKINQPLTPAAAQAAFPDLDGIWCHLIQIIEHTHCSPFLTSWQRLEEIFSEPLRAGIVSM